MFTGKRISPHEVAAYHDDVDIYWQACAWADTTVSCDWVRKTLQKGVAASKDGHEEFVLLCDNLTGQTHEDFKRAVREINGIVYYGPPGATNIWQPVDAAYGSTLKRLITQEQDLWLDLDENMDKWIGNKPLSASDRRILITQWVGEAHKRLMSKDYDNFR